MPSPSWTFPYKCIQNGEIPNCHSARFPLASFRLEGLRCALRYTPVMAGLSYGDDLATILFDACFDFIDYDSDLRHKCVSWRPGRVGA